MIHTTSPTGRARIEAFEGFEDHEYLDEAGLPTWGFGHRKRPGETCPVPLTRAIGDMIMTGDLATAEGCVNATVTVPIGQNQFDALVSLTFNIGTGGERSSTVLRLLDQGDYHGAADAFLMWDKVEDPKTKQLVVSQNLLARRKAERAVFLLDVPTDQAA